ncbi:MAG: hypothetical protein ABSF15_02280 [Candidatus Sulfotelmatobacter sp.]|jgi:hypothetical protein
MNGAKNSTKYLALLSRLLLGGDHKGGSVAGTGTDEDIAEIVSALSREDFGELWNLANSHHAMARTFPALHQVMVAEKNDRADWVEHALVKEQACLDHALSFLFPICDARLGVGDLMVIKFLDRWPDPGNDLDLYSNAQGSDVAAVMEDRFKAGMDERSWGDGLANKGIWSCRVCRN